MHEQEEQPKLGALDTLFPPNNTVLVRFTKPPKAMSDIGLIRKQFDRGNMANNFH